MREMKDSGVEWLGLIPGSWNTKKARWLFRERNEKGNPVVVQLLTPSQKYGVLPQEKYQEISGSKPVQVSEDKDLSDFKTVRRGDFCISLSAYMGGFEYSEYDGVISPAYHSFYKVSDEVNEDYYKYLFKSSVFIDVVNLITPNSVRVGRNTSFDSFKEVVLPVPEIFEQKKIAEFLNEKCAKIDSIIEKQQGIVEMLREYKSSVITEAVTKGLNPDVEMKDSGIECIGKIPIDWTVNKFKHMSIEIGDGLHGTPDYDSDGDYYFINGQNIGEEELVFTEKTDKINEGEYRKYKQVNISQNTIFITLNGATYGKTSFYNGEKVFLGKSAGYITFKDEENKKFIRYYLQSHAAKTIMDLSLCGSTIANLSLATLNEFCIPLPCEKEQIQIVNFLDKECSAIDENIIKKEEIINKLSDYKKSLIYEVVTGKREV